MVGVCTPSDIIPIWLFWFHDASVSRKQSIESTSVRFVFDPSATLLLPYFTSSLVQGDESIFNERIEIFKRDSIEDYEQT